MRRPRGAAGVRRPEERRTAHDDDLPKRGLADEAAASRLRALLDAHLRQAG
jgi:hypothetical protein